jgi:hypothetical protein
VITRTWKAVLEHIGGFGVVWSLVAVAFSIALWRSWPHATAFKCYLILWGISYAMCRTEQIKALRKKAAREALYAIWNQLTPEQAEAIRKGLNE